MEGAQAQGLRGMQELKLPPGASSGDFHITMHSLSLSMCGASDSATAKKA
jgi:hypothetical protein